MDDTAAEPVASARLWTTPPNVRLCLADDLAKLGSRNFVLQIGEVYFHGFAVSTDGGVHGYVDSCPHMGLSLESPDRQYLSPDRSVIVCARHGALFAPADGACLGGPCNGARLRPWPLEVRDGFVWTA